VALKVLDLIVYDLNALGLELLLHGGESPKMVLAREDTEAVDHAVGGHVWQAVGCVHGVADGSGSARAAEVAGNGAVAGDSAGRNLADDRVDALKKSRIPARSREAELEVRNRFALVP